MDGDLVVDFRSPIVPTCRIETVGEQGFELLTRQVLLSQRRNLSLVDLSSFDCMERLVIARAIAFDQHFAERGYRLPGDDA